ncbi:hypothetical protein ACEQPO_06845 [Bacillus sp. SL00103]
MISSMNCLHSYIEETKSKYSAPVNASGQQIIWNIGYLFLKDGSSLVTSCQKNRSFCMLDDAEYTVNHRCFSRTIRSSDMQRFDEVDL